MIKKIAFVGFPSRQREQTNRFWGEVLGFEMKYDHGDEHGYWAEFDAPDGKSICVDGFSPEGGTTYLALETDNIEEEVARLRAAGVTILKDTWDNQVCKMALIEDPDGRPIMLHQINPNRPPHPG